MKRLTPREVMEKIKEDRKLSNRTKDEWLEERNKVDLETKNAKENETEKEKISRLRLRNEYALALTKEETDLVSKLQYDDEEEARLWREKQINEEYLKRPEESKEEAKERLKKIKSNRSKPEPEKLFNREEAEAAAREYHKKKGQFQEVEETFEYQIGERGGKYEIRYSKRTGKPYRHYW